MSIVFKSGPKGGFYTIQNLPDYRFVCSSPVTSEVTLSFLESQDKQVFKGSYVSGVNNEVVFSLKDLLKPYFSHEKPIFHNEGFFQYYQYGLVDVVLTENKKQYKYSFNIFNIEAEINPDVSIYEDFLTLQPDVKEITVDSPEYLTAIHWNPKKLVVKFYLTDGSVEIATLFDSELNSVSVVTHNVSYKHVQKYSHTASSKKKPFYDVYFTDVNNNNVSRIQRYVVRESTGRERYYLSYNSLGGLDTLTTTGDIVEKPDVSFDMARTSSGFVSLNNADNHISYTQKTGYISMDNIPFVRDFILSVRDKYIFDPERCIFSKIFLTETDASFSMKESFSAFSFSYRKENDAIVIKRNEAVPQTLTIENMQSQVMPLAIQKREIMITESDGLFETEPIEFTFTPLVLSVQSYTPVDVYLSADKKSWTLKNTINCPDSISDMYREKIGTYLKVVSKKQILGVEAHKF